MTVSTTGTAAITFSGISSGLDTASIISQLMTVEAAPQTALKTRVATEQAQVTALQTLNTTIASLSTMADSFRTGSTWTQLTPTSSSTAVSVTASSEATPANLSVTVQSVATAAQLGFTSTATGTSAVVATPTGDSSADVLDVTLPDGSTSQVSIGDGKLSTIIKNLNALTDADGNQVLQASAVSVGGGQYSLLVTSASTGAGSLTISDPSGNAFFDASSVTSVAGSDAAISIGAGLTVTSSTNTFADVLPGVDLTLAAGTTAGTTAQVSITDDGSSRATAISTFVSTINSLLTSISTQTAYGTITAGSTATGAGTLAGNMDLRSVATQLLNAIFPDDGTTMASMGLDVDSDGALTFDQDKFIAAYQADPDGVQKAFVGDLTKSAAVDTTDSFISRVKAIADAASDSYDGTITASINALNDQISDENDQITAWDDRLAMKQATLENVYTNLETTLATMNTQQTWLTSALDGLDDGWSFSD